MIAILKNDFCRIRPRFGSMIAMLVMTFLSIFFAVYVTGVQQVKGHIALITSSSAKNLDAKNLHIDMMTQKPPHSALVRQEYDAIVTDRGNGEFTIETLRSETFKSALQRLLKNPQAQIPAQKSDRGVGTNVVGFLMIFLGMSAFFYFFPFAEDKEQGQLLRNSASPLSFNSYLAANFMFCLCSFVPPWIALAVLHAVGWNIGFSVGQYAGLFLILAILGSTFALLLNTLFQKPDNANMFGTSIIIVTSTLAGCFYAVSKDNVVLDHLLPILPQKQFMNFAGYLQSGEALQHPLPVLYILAVALVMFGVAYRKLRHDYVERA